MIDLVPVKRDMLRYVQDMRVVTGMVGAWIKRKEVVVRTRRIRREKLREYQYREGYVRSFEGKGVEWNGSNNIEHMSEQVKWAMVERAKE